MADMTSRRADRQSESDWQSLRIVSGGQTGVDQAALQMAIDLGIDHGGWCPRGRRCEAGRIPAKFCLRESHSAKYWVRTEQNVIDSDATLILHAGRLSGGTAFTERMAIKHGRAVRCIDLGTEFAQAADVRRWLRQFAVQVLNVAGPRESSVPGIYERSYAFLLAIFRRPSESLQSG
jgi:hypothetical protein